jgi:hypothetical protein
MLGSIAVVRFEVRHLFAVLPPDASPASGLRVVHELAQFLVASACRRDLRGPMHGSREGNSRIA